MNATKYTLVLREIVENPRKPERSYKLEYRRGDKDVTIPGVYVVRTQAELDRLERV